MRRTHPRSPRRRRAGWVVLLALAVFGLCAVQAPAAPGRRFSRTVERGRVSWSPLRNRQPPAQLASASRLRRLQASSRPYIVGGSPASAGSFPWLAFVTYNAGGGTGFTCSGTVVSPNVVLTAGHCGE